MGEASAQNSATTSMPQANSSGADNATPAEWQTLAERTQYRQTPRYDETIEYARRLDRASNLIRYTEFGRSAQNRALPLLIAASDEDFTPQAAHRHNKAVVLVQACIHPGEPDGKDAGLALLRDIAINKTHQRLLDRVVILFIPIYNTDGHERFSAYNRINQNGPEEMGWRGTATNLNLNRDYMKADAPETRAWLRLWQEWSPDLFIDCHVTDGADYQYNITWQYEGYETVSSPVRNWMKDAFESRVFPQTERAGNLLAPYLSFADNRTPEKGIFAFISTPRFATGYAPLVRNRPALLIETHMLKDFRSRVRGTYDLLVATLEEVNKNTGELLSAVRAADDETTNAGRTFDASRSVALNVRLTDQSTPFNFKGIEFRNERSDVSGAVRVIYGTKPIEMSVPFFRDARPSVSVTAPLYYIVPPQWADVIERLRWHGLRLQRLANEETIEVESYRFKDVKWAAGSFEGRVPVTFGLDAVRERRVFPAGSVVVSMSQPSARAALHLLEPSAPDSLATWGFFNSIFEQKEYGEDYVLEKLAHEMLARDEKLRREFEQRLLDDPKFAASPRERLKFFFDRSPYLDARLNLYPVGRIRSPFTAKTSVSP